MTAHDFKTYVHSDKAIVGTIGLPSSFKTELEDQVSQHPLLKIAKTQHDNPEYIFCLISANNSDSKKLITESLEASIKHKSKLYFVFRNLDHHQKQDILNYINKNEIYKTHPPLLLDFDHSLNNSEVIDDLLRRIVHNYQRHPKKNHSQKKYKSQTNLIFKLTATALLLVVLLITQVVVRNLFLLCTLKSLNNNYHPPTICITGLKYANSFIDYYSVVGNTIPLADKKLNLNLEWHQVSLHLSESLGKLKTANRIMGQIFYHLLNSDRPIDPNVLPKLEETLAASNSSLGFLQASLKEMYLTSENQLVSIEDLGEEINRLQVSTNQLQKISKDLPKLLSQSTPSTVLVVVQDNTELRPSGGFIDTVLIVSLDSGHVSKIEAVDTFSLDQNLNGVVTPPEKYRELTGNTKWYLRDSNWDADFPQAASQINWFLQKERGLSADIIVGINLTLFDEIATLTNKSQQKNFTKAYLDLAQAGEGSSYFILETVRDLITKVKNFSESQFSELSSVFLKQLQDREMLVYPTSFVAPSLSHLGWDGALFVRDCTNFNMCAKSGYIYFVDTNIGLNKSDAFMRKQRESQIVISEEKAVGHHILKYTNSSPKNTWPSGSHKNYLRIYFPDNIALEQITENGRELVTGEYEIQKINNSNTFEVSLFVETPPQSESQIEISTRSAVSDSETFDFSFYFPKQPGLKLSEQTVNISYPNTWLATTYSLPEFASSGVLGYNLGSLNSNRPEVIKFIKNLHE